jgi:8-oxo-dGTP diphosphatase
MRSADMSRTRTPSAEEQAFLESYDATRFPRPSVAVDVVVLAIEDEQLRVALVKRAQHPFVGDHALPGGFLGVDESPEEAARRVLREKVGLEPDWVEQLYTFGDPRRDPRTRVLTIAHLVIVQPERLRSLRPEVVVAEVEVPWEGETGGPAHANVSGARVPLAFDHAEILGVAALRLRGKLFYTRVGFAFLPERFTLAQARSVYEVVLGRRLNKDSFRRMILASHDLVPTGERQQDVGHRPAELYPLGRRHVDPLST